MIKRNFTICCDMDDTIEDLVGAWVVWLNTKYNLYVSKENVTAWDLHVAFPTLTDEQIFEPLSIPEFWNTVTPKLDSVKYLQKLIEDGHKVYICTSTDYSIAKEKFDRALFKHFPFIDRHNIIISYNKQMIKCDYLIDDGIHNIVGDYIGLLIDMPHNRGFIADSVIRVFNFEAVYNIINEAACR